MLLILQFMFLSYHIELKCNLMTMTMFCIKCINNDTATSSLINYSTVIAETKIELKMCVQLLSQSIENELLMNEAIMP